MKQAPTTAEAKFMNAMSTFSAAPLARIATPKKMLAAYLAFLGDDSWATEMADTPEEGMVIAEQKILAAMLWADYIMHNIGKGKRSFSLGIGNADGMDAYNANDLCLPVHWMLNRTDLILSVYLIGTNSFKSKNEPLVFVTPDEATDKAALDLGQRMGVQAAQLDAIEIYTLGETVNDCVISYVPSTPGRVKVGGAGPHHPNAQSQWGANTGGISVYADLDAVLHACRESGMQQGDHLLDVMLINHAGFGDRVLPSSKANALGSAFINYCGKVIVTQGIESATEGSN